jgi:DNA polymerase-1
MQHKTKRLFLIDAYAMIFRGYYALIRSPRLTSKGDEYLCNLWIYQFINRAYKKEKPTHLAVVFDVGGKTLRHDDF